MKPKRDIFFSIRTRGSPTLVQALPGPSVQVTAGSNHTAVLLIDGQVFTFGSFSVRNRFPALCVDTLCQSCRTFKCSWGSCVKTVTQTAVRRLTLLTCIAERTAGAAHSRYALLERQTISHAQHWCQIRTQGNVDWCKWRPDILANWRGPHQFPCPCHVGDLCQQAHYWPGALLCVRVPSV